MALGAEPVTTTVEGRERYTVSIRYPRDYRSDPQAIASDVLIPLPDGGTVPLGEVAKVSLAQGPASIRTENAPARRLHLCRSSATATSAAMSPTRRRRWPRRSSFRPATTSPGAASSNIWSAPKARLQDRRAGDAADHLPAALSQLPPHDRDADRHAVGAVRAGRRPLADVVARLQPVGRGRGRLHRACRRRGRDRRRDADLSRSRADGAAGAARSAKDGRSRATTSTPRSWSARSSACARR